jgi:hypothetical protein
MLEPFVLTDEDVQKEEKLEISHYAKRSILHRKVTEARKEILLYRSNVEKRHDEEYDTDEDSTDKARPGVQSLESEEKKPSQLRQRPTMITLSPPAKKPPVEDIPNEV